MKDAANGRNTLVNVAEDLFNSRDLHEYKAFDWITRIQMILSNIDPIKRLWLVELLPGYTDGLQDYCPFLDVESKFLLAYSSKLLKLVDYSLTIETLNASIDVSREAEQARCVLIWNLLNHTDKISWVSTLWNGDDFR